ncbi:S8 family serine peptidase [Pseudocolwellia agarivorans]|uniref:S8 family serine peptidase n=1 Tax=Pseudocolwellia agarivorans TaxID=1911682 RepID=UPI000986CC12|nr:S8 family serine peptidase [Pseudocolwellia agarivorans]
MIKIRQAVLIFCISITLPTSLKADGLLGKPLSSIENSILNDKVINRQNNIINKKAEEIKKKAAQQANLNKLLIKLPENEVSSLILPVGNLTEPLNILDNAGKILFKDVEVENGWRAIEHQWLVMSSQQELTQLKQLAQNNRIEIVNTKSFNALALTLVQFKVQASFDSAEKIVSILPVSLHKKLTRDYVYQTQSLKELNQTKIPADANKTDITSTACLAPLSIGMVDTAIDVKHPVFKNKSVTRQSFVPANLTAPKAHGTAVSALLISSSPQLPALLPNAKLFAAEVFYGQSDFSQGANLFSLVAGINWLLEQHVSVINMSLAGPNNTILATVIESALAKNITIVAAVGNEGPHSPPLYPAAYKNVIGVTAVDKNNKLYRWANRGDYVDFSARGVSVKTARLSGDFGYESGTSMAAPVVTAYAACAKFKNEQDDLLQLLTQQAVDLGEKGHDPLFGYGRLGD